MFLKNFYEFLVDTNVKQQLIRNIRLMDFTKTFLGIMHACGERNSLQDLMEIIIESMLVAEWRE